jgi:hypothetical protein
VTQWLAAVYVEVQVFGVLVGTEVGQDASCAVFGGDLCRDIADDLASTAARVRYVDG